MAAFHDPLIKEDTGSLSTPGFWLTQLVAPVKKQRYGYPILMGEGGEKEGIHGYAGDLHCPNCGENFDFILIEFKDPFASCLIGDTSIIEDFDEDIKNCPNCGHKELILAPM